MLVRYYRTRHQDLGHLVDSWNRILVLLNHRSILSAHVLPLLPLFTMHSISQSFLSIPSPLLHSNPPVEAAAPGLPPYLQEIGVSPHHLYEDVRCWLPRQRRSGAERRTL